MKVFILAAGQHTRWKITGNQPPLPKQLMMVGDLPVICRTIQQVIDYDPIVVTYHDQIIQAIAPYHVQVYDPRPVNRWTCETVLSTQQFWDTDRTVILLGDVLYDHKAMTRILAMPQIACGHRHELFAMQWRYWMNEWAVYCCQKCCQMVESGHLDDGKLFALYRLMAAMPDPAKHTFDDRYLFLEDGITQDFDMYQEYLKFCDKLFRGKIKL